MNKEEIHKADFKLNKEAPILSSISKNDLESIKVPKNYFDELPHLLSNKTKAKPSFSWQNLKWAIPSISIVLIGLVVVLKPVSNTQPEINTQDLFYAILDDSNEHLDLAIQFESTNVNYEELKEMDYEEFNYDLPVKTESIDLNILFE